MEGFEGFLEGEWESLSKMFSCEDSDLLLLHCNGTHANYEDGVDFLLPSNSSLESSHSSSNEIESSHFAFFDHENRGEFAPKFDDHAMGFPTMIHDDLVGEMLQLKAQMLSTNHLDNGPKGIEDSCNEMQLKRKCEAKKRNKKQPKKAKKDPRNDEEINNTVQSSSTSTSEEETHTASDSTGKAKTTKPPASDPQSLYARKRREKINERLKILQNLVPNGTKVDISTMLEEAVQYVKFLQLQIKLLSSDDMWMYAPIAYNGMDIGLYQKIVPSL